MLEATPGAQLVEPFGFDEHLLAIQEGGETLLTRLRALLAVELGGFLGQVIRRLLVGGDKAFEVAQDDLVVRHADQVIGHDGDLAAPAGSVDHVGGHSVTGSVATQTLHDLDALGNRGAEVTGTVHQVTLVDVVGANADAYQVLHQLAHDVDVVVDACQQDRLVAQGDAGAGELIGGSGELGGDLVGMVDVDIEPQGVEALEHVTQLVSDAHGQEDRARASRCG